MSTETYYCPLCGNKPAAPFVPCRILERPICNDCDDTIREFFQHENDAQSELPAAVENLRDYSGLSQHECKEIWQKEQMVTLLLSLRDGVNCYDESGDIWETRTLKELLYLLDELIVAGSFLKEQR